jgi:uncharacterized protein YjdB
VKETQKVRMIQKEYSKNRQENGITLIALVVTIIVMLILAGITIQTTIGDGGIIDLAKQSKEEQLIASYKDRIGIVGINWSLNRALDDSVTIDGLWQDMQDVKIINNKETDVEKVDERGNYIITVPEGYKFHIHINEYDDVEIDYIGKEDELLPYINEITVISQTTNSVELQVSVSRLNGGTLNYYYKEKGESDENYQLIKRDTTELTASISGLTDKTTYEIKVEATNKNGTTEKIVEVLIGELKGTITQKGETVWGNGTAIIHLETQVPNADILYQINTLDGVYKPYDDEQGITGLKYGDTVYAVLSDGTNITEYTSINILDNQKPQQAKIELSGTSVTTTGSITATITHTDNESGVDIGNCKWEYNTNTNPIGTEESSYTNVFSNNQPITLNASTPGIYYLHVLTVDKAGNKIESISQGISVTQLVTGITVSPTSVALEEGKTQQLTANITPDNASNKTVSWSSNNTNIATVSSTGLVTAKTVGTVTITVKANDGSNQTATCRVTVNPIPPNIKETLEEGDYVYYDTGTAKGAIKCVVLYGPKNANYKDYGIQIIAMETVEDIELGNGTGSTQTDMTYFNTAMNSYNNAIATLNNATNKYINTTYASEARCVGSVPNNKNSQSGYYIRTDSWFKNYNGKFRDGERNFETDWKKMEELGIKEANDMYWLASRNVTTLVSNPVSSNFAVFYGAINGSYALDMICEVYNGFSSSRSASHGLRPVFTLKPEIKVTGGSGTSDDPYTLGT